MRNKTLTDQELESAYLARYDLGPGYPQLMVPEFISQLYLDDSIEEKSLRFPPNWSPEMQANVDRDLSTSLRKFIRLDTSEHFESYVTFSGSIALDRAIASVQIASKRKNKKNIHVVTTSPCIDIMRLFLCERADVTAHFVESYHDGIFGAICADTLCGLLKELSERFPEDQLCVLISSPENPTGELWSEYQLIQLSMICSELGAILIVDHCFLVAGVHSSDKICRIWDIVTPSLDWIAIWDTGKTFGFNEDKIGFLITSSEGMKAAIRKSLSVLQFGISRRAKLFFTALFRQANIHRHIEQLRHFCRLNLEMLKDQRCESFCVRDVGAGSLALVDISGTGVEDEEIRELLLKNGVGVVSGNVFFHTDWKKNNYIRIALARDPAYFNEAIEKLLECIR